MDAWQQVDDWTDQMLRCFRGVSSWGFSIAVLMFSRLDVSVRENVHRLKIRSAHIHTKRLLCLYGFDTTVANTQNTVSDCSLTTVWGMLQSDHLEMCVCVFVFLSHQWYRSWSEHFFFNMFILYMNRRARMLVYMVLMLSASLVELQVSKWLNEVFLPWFGPFMFDGVTPFKATVICDFGLEINLI